MAPVFSSVPPVACVSSEMRIWRALITHPLDYPERLIKNAPRHPNGSCLLDDGKVARIHSASRRTWLEEGNEEPISSEFVVDDIELAERRPLPRLPSVLSSRRHRRGDGPDGSAPPVLRKR